MKGHLTPWLATIDPKQTSPAGHYDALETALTNYLNIKVILIKGWQTPDSYYTAKANCDFARMDNSQEALDKAQVDFAKEESNMLGSLRSNIAARDPLVGTELSENDLRSLQGVGHVTLRKGNAEPEQAVLIFDPGENPHNEADPVISWVLKESFDNAWDIFGKNRNLSVSSFIENFDISAEDKRIYQATMNVRYALQNQSEYNDQGKGYYYEPFFYDFAGLSKGDDTPGMWKEAWQLPFKKAVDNLSMEPYRHFDELGVKDPKFIEKLRMAGAIKDLVYSSIDTIAFDTFARLSTDYAITPKQIVEIQQDLRKKLEEKAKQHRTAGQKHDFGMDSEAFGDWRVLFPAFREVYQEDKSTGAQRAYYDTIMAGLQKWFPTLTNGPVPELDTTKEPPREVPQQAAPAAAAQKKKMSPQ